MRPTPLLSLAVLWACNHDCPKGQEWEDGACEPGGGGGETATGTATGTGTGTGATGSGTGAGTGTGTGTTSAPTLLPGATWQWQLTGNIDTSHDVDAYDVDLFDARDADLNAIRNAGRFLICYFSAGSYEEWRDDAGDFPVSAIGQTLDGWPDERWLDHRDPTVRQVMVARLEHAVSRGCHAVEPDNVTAFDTNSGFPLTANDQLDYNRFLADEAHSRGLQIALKNDTDQIPQLIDWFDFTVNEECHEYDECYTLTPFIQAGKAVLNAEYVNNLNNAPALLAQICGTYGLSTIVKDWDLGPSLHACP